jgi:hypothetical protein
MDTVTTHRGVVGLRVRAVGDHHVGGPDLPASGSRDLHHKRARRTGTELTATKDWAGRGVLVGRENRDVATSGGFTAQPHLQQTRIVGALVGHREGLGSAHRAAAPRVRLDRQAPPGPPSHGLDGGGGGGFVGLQAAMTPRLAAATTNATAYRRHLAVRKFRIGLPFVPSGGGSPASQCASRIHKPGELRLGEAQQRADGFGFDIEDSCHGVGFHPLVA